MERRGCLSTRRRLVALNRRRFGTSGSRATSVSSATKAPRPVGGGVGGAVAGASGPAAAAVGGSSTGGGGSGGGTMLTYVRIKPSPLNGFEPGGMGSFAAGATSATVTMLTDAGMSKVAASGSGAGGGGGSSASGPALAVKEYTVRGVLGPTSRQCDVYSSTLAPIIPHLFAGHNACCALYGMTGSGEAQQRGCRLLRCCRMSSDATVVCTLPRAPAQARPTPLAALSAHHHQRPG